MQEKKSIELIILEGLGCLDSDNRYDFQSSKQTDENFPWKVLGVQFQNLSALLPSILIISDLPSAAAKERMINKLSHSLSTESSHYQPAKFVPAMEKKHEDNEQLEEILTKNKIDWGELSVSNQSQQPVSGYEEVMPKAPTIKRDLTEFDDTVESAKDMKPGTSSEEELTNEKEINTTSSSKLKRYVMVSIIAIGALGIPMSAPGLAVDTGFVVTPAAGRQRSGVFGIDAFQGNTTQFLPALSGPLRIPRAAAVTTVLAARGYPDAPEKGAAISIPDRLPDGVTVFHAGTTRGRDGVLRASGGRAPPVTAVPAAFARAQAASRAASEAIAFEGKVFRRDIGWREAARQARAGTP